MENIVIKTMKDWKSDFSEDFKIGDRVDNEIYEHFLNVLPPLVNKINYFQISEPYGSDEKGRSTYLTLKHDGISWIYLGHCCKNGKKHVPSIWD